MDHRKKKEIQRGEEDEGYHWDVEDEEGAEEREERICGVGFYASCEFLVSCNISNFPALSEFISVSEDCQGLKQAGEKRNNSRFCFLEK